MARHRFEPAATLLAMALVMCVTGCGSGHASTSPSAGAPPSTSPTGTNKRVTMPPVQGDGVHIAMQLVKSSGLKKIKQVSKHSGVTAGIVTFTVPFAEQVVLADSLVTLYVSSGPALCAECAGGGATEVMPPVCGLNLRQAELLLAQNNITLPRTIRRASSRPAGTVIGSAPGAHTRFVAYGRTAKEVVLFVSSGPGTSSAAGGQGGC